MLSSIVGNFELFLQKERRYSPHTLLAYRKDLTDFLSFGQVTRAEELEEISYQLIRSWTVELMEQQNKPRSVSRKLSTLRTFFKWLLRTGYIAVDPMLRIRAPKIEKRLPSFARVDEMEKLKEPRLFPDNFDGLRDQLMIELFYQTGIRRIELIDLAEVNVSADQIKVLGKRRKERIIPLGNELVSLIDRYRKSKPSGPDSAAYFFVNGKGRKLNEKFVYRKINGYLGTVTNLQKRSPHVLRHTFATHMLNSGAGLETLKELLGHASLAATQVYTHNSFAQVSSIYSQAHPRGHKK